jgi:hypothetical protein
MHGNRTETSPLPRPAPTEGAARVGLLEHVRASRRTQRVEDRHIARRIERLVKTAQMARVSFVYNMLTV